MDEGCAAIIGFLILAAIVIALIVYVILPISLFILGGIALAGAVSGVGVAVKNFGEVVIEGHQTVK